MTPQLDTLAELLPCPFCGEHLQIRQSVNPYGFCDTEGCWMSDRKISVVLDDPGQVAAWNTRDNLPAIREETCPICDGHEMQPGEACIAGCRNGKVR